MENRIISPDEPQSANHYHDRITDAVKSVMLEVGQILGAFQGKFSIVGGSVPWLLMPDHEMDHVGTVDLDIALDEEALGDAYVNSSLAAKFWMDEPRRSGSRTLSGKLTHC